MSLNVPSGSSDSSPIQMPASIESVRLHISSAVARYQSRISFDTLRPLPVFLGVNPVGFCLSPGAFTPPVKKVDKASPEKIRSRIQLNIAYFLSNYALMAAMTAVVVSLMHPSMLLFLGIVYGLWSLHSYMIRHEAVVFGIPLHTLLTVQQRFYGLFVITALVVILKCLVPALIFVAISSVLILGHAALRDPKHIETSSLRAADSDDEFVDEEEGALLESAEEVLVERPSS